MIVPLKWWLPCSFPACVHWEVFCFHLLWRSRLFGKVWELLLVLCLVSFLGFQTAQPGYLNHGTKTVWYYDLIWLKRQIILSVPSILDIMQVKEFHLCILSMILKLMPVSMVRLCSFLASWAGSIVICSSYRNFVWSSTSCRKCHCSRCPLPVWGHDHLLLLQWVHARRFPEERLPRKWNMDTVSCLQR